MASTLEGLHPSCSATCSYAVTFTTPSEAALVSATAEKASTMTGCLHTALLSVILAAVRWAKAKITAAVHLGATRKTGPLHDNTSSLFDDWWPPYLVLLATELLSRQRQSQHHVCVICADRAGLRRHRGLLKGYLSCSASE